MVQLVWRSICSNRFKAVTKAMPSFACAGISLFVSGHFFDETAMARKIYHHSADANIRAIRHHERRFLRVVGIKEYPRAEGLKVGVEVRVDVFRRESNLLRVERESCIAL